MICALADVVAVTHAQWLLRFHHSGKFRSSKGRSEICCCNTVPGNLFTQYQLASLEEVHAVQVPAQGAARGCGRCGEGATRGVRGCAAAGRPVRGARPLQLGSQAQAHQPAAHRQLQDLQERGRIRGRRGHAGRLTSRIPRHNPFAGFSCTAKFGTSCDAQIWQRRRL